MFAFCIFNFYFRKPCFKLNLYNKKDTKRKSFKCMNSHITRNNTENLIFNIYIKIDS